MTLTPLFLLAQAAPAAAGEAPATAAQNPMQMILLWVPLMVIFYFILIRPQQKQRKQHEKLVASIKTGDSVVTSGGMHGIVANVKDKTVLVKVADNVKIEFDRAAITAIDRSDSTSEVAKA